MKDSIQENAFCEVSSQLSIFRVFLMITQGVN